MGHIFLTLIATRQMAHRPPAPAPPNILGKKQKIRRKLQQPQQRLQSQRKRDSSMARLQDRSKGPCDVFDPWVRWERGQVGI